MDEKLGKGRLQASNKFRAFISYSHADFKIATKLHRKIENYRLPPRLREAVQDEASSLPDGRIGKVFRDREDLPAAQDLSQAVKLALKNSETLIVLCSADAKASPWVAKEISLFRSLHPDRPILAAIVSGEPEDVLPEELKKGSEPLAADLRKEGDGWRLGFLKIIAGITELPLDALVQRDAQRQLRRVTMVTGGSIAVMLLMAAMTVSAIQSRKEAQHQRAEAESLIEYMLTDLRNELKGVGRIDVMTNVNERAMDYYRDDQLSDLPADSLERRARILHAMGEDNEKTGDMDKALEKFLQAHRITGELLSRDQMNENRVFAHSQSEYWLGYASFNQQELEPANQHFREYLNLANQLERLDPSNPDWIKEVGFAEGNLCAMALQPPVKADEAISFCGRATQKFVELNAINSDDPLLLSDLANRYAWDADAYVAAGQLEKALGKRWEQVNVLLRAETIAPKSLEISQNIMLGYLSLTEAYIALKKESDAKVYLKEAESYFSILHETDPENKKWHAWGQRIEKQKLKLKGN